MQLRVHPTYLVAAGAAWSGSAAAVFYSWPYVFEGGLLAGVVALGAGLAVRPGVPRPKTQSPREMLQGGAETPVKLTRTAGTADVRGGPRAPPTVAPTGSVLDPIPLEVVGVEPGPAPHAVALSARDAADEVEVTVAPAPAEVPWARAEATAPGPLMFEGAKPLATEQARRVWAARDPPEQAKVQIGGVIHGVCGRCGTRISVANRRPVWATCPVCGHSKLLN